MSTQCTDCGIDMKDENDVLWDGYTPYCENCFDGNFGELDEDYVEDNRTNSQKGFDNVGSALYSFQLIIAAAIFFTGIAFIVGVIKSLF